MLFRSNIYVKAIHALLPKFDIHAMAHITGGGLLENIPRVLPDNTIASINKNSWQLPDIFQWLQENGNVEDSEMHRTFNCGIGMVLIVNTDDADNIVSTLNDMDEKAWNLGSIDNGSASSDSTAHVIFK